MVSDEVWLRLDRGAGRLSRRTARRLTLAIVLALALVVAASVTWQGGLLLADLRVDGTSSSVGPEIGIGLGVTVRNDGWVPVTVVGAGADLPGLRLVSVGAPDRSDPTPGRPFTGFPFTIAPGESVELLATYEVTDCDAVPGTLTLPVRVRRWWGTWTARVPPNLAPSNHPGWLHSYALYVCGRIAAPF
jgi:hypothetical protein